MLAAGADGSLFLSWIDLQSEPDNVLRFARWAGSGWEKPQTIAQGKNWFINWADFPALQVLPDGSMLAHWLTKAEGAESYGYGDPDTKDEWREIAGMKPR